MRTRRLLLLGALALLGCNPAPAEPSPPRVLDAAAPGNGGGPSPVADASPGATVGASGCFTNPTTYLEIINACTDAEAVDKQVDLSSMNLADGGLQPLP